MKNFILLNYNILPKKIYIKNNQKYFFFSNEKIYIVESDKKEKDLLYLFRLSNDIYNNGMKINTFIINRDGKYITKKDGFYIILMKENEYESDISIYELSKYHDINNNLEQFDILKDWMNEIDTIEKELIEYNKEYQLIQNSVDYFIGCAENAIQLLGKYGNLIINNSNNLCHKVDYKLYTNYQLNNPFTFIKTNKMYDIANYIKYCFLINSINYEEITEIIINNSEFDNVFLFSNLLYPNTYFSLVKHILLNKEEEDKIKTFIRLEKKYFKLLINIKSLIKNVKELELINWISE